MAAVFGTAAAPADRSGSAGRGLTKKAAAEQSFVPGELIVRFRAGVGSARRSSVLRAEGARVDKSLGTLGLKLVRLGRGASVRAAAAALERRPEILYAEPNYLRSLSAIPNDLLWSDLWGLDAINAPEAWDTQTGSPDVIVAVVDSGVAYGHPDLDDNIWVNVDDPLGDADSNGDDDDDLNGYEDDVRGWDFFAGDADPSDTLGHGTHVAGTIGAEGNNATGVAGANWDVAVMPLRVGGAQGVPVSAVIEAFAYACANGAQVVNASFGNINASLGERDVIRSAPCAGTLFVAAAGNENVNLDRVNTFPCEYALANVVCVAASTETDARAPFSNYGPTSVDLAAPGVDIQSSIPAWSSIYSTGFESFTAFSNEWTPDLLGGYAWGLSPGKKFAGTSSAADSPPLTPYMANSNTWIQSNDAFDLSGEEGCRLRYRLWLEVEDDFDIFFVDGSTDAVDWTPIVEYTGSTEDQFELVEDDLSGYDGESVYLRLGLFSDSVIEMEGAYVDDFAVQCIGSTFAGDEYELKSGTSMATPLVAGVAALLFAENPAATATQVRLALLRSVDIKPGLVGRVVTRGRLNADRALRGDFNPKPLVRVSDARVTESNAGTRKATFLVTLSTTSALNVTVRFGTANGTARAPRDYAKKSGKLTFLPGEVAKKVVVSVKGDRLDERNEIFWLNLSAPANASLADRKGRGTIRDND